MLGPYHCSIVANDLSKHTDMPLHLTSHTLPFIAHSTASIHTIIHHSPQPQYILLYTTAHCLNTYYYTPQPQYILYTPQPQYTTASIHTIYTTASIHWYTIAQPQYTDYSRASIHWYTASIHHTVAQPQYIIYCRLNIVILHTTAFNTLSVCMYVPQYIVYYWVLCMDQMAHVHRRKALYQNAHMYRERDMLSIHTTIHML